MSPVVIPMVHPFLYSWRYMDVHKMPIILPPGRISMHLPTNTTFWCSTLSRLVPRTLTVAGTGSSPPATFVDPKGPDASLLMWNFFADHPRAVLTVSAADTRTGASL